MDWYRITVDLLQAYAWPLAVLALGALFLVRYRPEFGGLLSRIREASTPFGRILAQDEVPDEVGEQLKELAGFVEEQRVELAEKTKGTDDWQQLASQLQVAYWYETTYRLIWGSQISLLQYLNQTAGGIALGAPNLFYQLHLSQARSVTPSYQLSQNDFMAFLSSEGLITIQGGSYVIAPWGQGFLSYTVTARMDPLKAW